MRKASASVKSVYCLWIITITVKLVCNWTSIETAGVQSAWGEKSEPVRESEIGLLSVWWAAEGNIDYATSKRSGPVICDVTIRC